MTQNTKYATAVEALLSLENCTRYGARFLSRSGDPTFYPYQEILRRALGVAGILRAHGLRPGDRAAIVLPTSISIFDAFLGAQLAGGIPAALYPPLRLGRLAEYLSRSQRMLRRIGARFLITDSRVKQLIGAVTDSVPSLERVLDIEKLSASVSWSPVVPDPDSTAFLQFTSGTTADPSAVVVSHTNLIHNLEMMDSVFSALSESENEQGGVCWLPLYHDMGLIGCMLMGLYHPGTVTYLGPELFIAKPALWLQTLSRYKAVASPAPNFAYGYCLNRIRDEEMTGLDLSNWRVAFNGAEPIEVDIMHRFSQRFARWGFRAEAMTPVYGLAEAGLGVSFSDPRTPPLVMEFDQEILSRENRVQPGMGRKLPSLGGPLPGLNIEIRDREGRQLTEGRVGTIVVQGPSVTSGYYNDAETSTRTIRDNWLDTGDLGFIYQGNLYITGRSKDLIIIRGRNYAPQEIEELVHHIEGVRTGCVVARGYVVEGIGEQLVILAERDTRSAIPETDIAATIRERVLSAISLTVCRVEVLAPGTLPRTSSGKLRRADALQMLLAGELRPPESLGTTGLVTEIIRSRLAWVRFWLRRKPGI